MIIVILCCDECGAEAESPYVHSIDRYDYHDAPSDGITFSEPTGWWFSATGYSQPKDLVALCTVHNTKDERNKRLGY